MKATSTLTWSGFTSYENCPQQFLWLFGWGSMDLGAGFGYPRPLPRNRPSRHKAVMGTVLSTVSQKLYNEELVALKAGILKPTQISSRLEEIVENEFIRTLEDPRNRVDWTRAGMTADEMKARLVKAAVSFLETMKRNRLVGEYAKAEVELGGWIDKWNPIGGRADLIIRRSDSGISIFDGKYTSNRKALDADQLRWYALCFKLGYKTFPDRLGFILYATPAGTPILDGDGAPRVGEDGAPLTEEGVDWVPFTKEDLEGLATRAVEVRQGLRREKFEANPVPTYCRTCVYESVCLERKGQRQENAARNGKDKKVEEIVASDGFSDFSV